MRAQLDASSLRPDLMTETELKRESEQLLRELAVALRAGGAPDLKSPAWSEVRSVLTEISRTRAERGFSPTETATFVLSLKQPLFEQLQQQHDRDAAKLGRELWNATQLVDELGLYTTQEYLRTREGVIQRQ